MQIKIFLTRERQVVYLIKILAFFWFITKAWTYKAWVVDREYPVIAPSEALDHIPGSVHVILLFFSFLALLAILLFKQNRFLLILLFAAELLSCALDTVRWQPWEYMYLCILLVLIINFMKPRNIILLVHWLLVSVYLFSGLHKFSRVFLSEVWVKMILTGYLHFPLPLILTYKLFFAGLLIPLTEIMLAVLLYRMKNKKPVSYMLVFMHLGILLFIGPFGLQYNSVVWFWNLFMICLLFVVYRQPLPVQDRRFFIRQAYWTVIWFILPVFSFSGMWYQYFSFNLYSGKNAYLYVCFPQRPAMKSIFIKLPHYAHPENQKEVCIGLQDWAMVEMRLVPLPEPEIYRKIAERLKQKYAGLQVSVFLYNPVTGKRTDL